VGNSSMKNVGRDFKAPKRIDKSLLPLKQNWDSQAE